MSLSSVKAQIASAYRDYAVDGLPVSGPNEPAKEEQRVALSNLADLVLTAGSTLVYGTVALMNAATPPAQVGARAEVRADPGGDVADKNGVWGWSGSAWVWIASLLPASVTTALDDSAAAIQKAAGFLAMSGGFHPTAQRPVSFLKLTETLAFIDIYPHANNYRGGLKRRMGDKIRYWVKDAGPAMAITRNWTVIGKSSIFAGREQAALTSIFNDMIGGVTTDTGQVPTALRPPVTVGEFVGAGDVAAYVISGDFHGHKAYLSQGLIGTLNDVSTGGVDVNASLVDWPVGVPWQGNKIVIDGAFGIKTSSGKTAAVLNESDAFESASSYSWYYSGHYDFAHASVNCTPGVATIYVAVGASSELDRAVGIVNGVPAQWSHNGVPMTDGGQPVKVLQLLNRDDELYNPGNAEKIVQFDSHFPNIKDETRVGVGYNAAYRINGEWTALDSGVPLQDRVDPGPKWGAQSEGSGNDATDFTGKTMTFSQFHTVAFDPETYA